MTEGETLLAMKPKGEPYKARLISLTRIAKRSFPILANPNPIIGVDTRQPDVRRIEALRRYHASRPGKTRQKLNEAFDRMLAGTTVIVDPKHFRLNKATLAREAEISIHTLLKKEKTGERRFADVIARLESEKPNPKLASKSDDERDQKIAELRCIVADISNDKLISPDSWTVLRWNF